MITYAGGAFGFVVLFRLHGSAVFKSFLPAFLSSIVYLLLFQYTDVEEEDIFLHPYPIGALVSAFSFLLVFRANFSYHRYWEAFTAIHQMHSRWLDFSTEVAAFHYQSNRYDQQKPPAFGNFPNVKSITRERERLEEPMTKEELEDHIDDIAAENTNAMGATTSLRTRFLRRRKKKKEHSEKTRDINQRNNSKNINTPGTKEKKKKQPKPYNDKSFSEDRISLFTTMARQHLKVGCNNSKDTPPALFLEEVAHLLSLLSAVAMSTLRNDIENAESPLIEFIPDQPWPHVDPDDYQADVRKEWTRSTHRGYTVLRYLFGVSRTDKSRTLYNAGRPFRVIGNVSDAEIELLQVARGPLAKVSLCSMWLQEFLSREYLNGSTGNVAPPIVSRLYQYVSDGLAGYNQARKIAYIPFPFPHAQITTLFVLVIVVFMPLLMLTFVTNQVVGLHEVARELENPFKNVPNDLPLNNFQAQFNEGLMMMFRGYHPDSCWIPQDEETRTLLSAELERVASPVKLPPPTPQDEQPDQVVVVREESVHSSVSSDRGLPPAF
eukprot:scaffold260_cov115-Cylindrotheca_fusiformis.AAC.4